MSQSKSKTSSSNGPAPNGGASNGSNQANGSSKAAARVPALAKAVSLHLEGNLQEALDEINGALAAGEESLRVMRKC
jgi:hypothetical protein